MSENSEKMPTTISQIYLNSLFDSTNSPKPEHVPFIIIYNQEKQQVLTFEKLIPGDVWHFSLKLMG